MPPILLPCCLQALGCRFTDSLGLDCDLPIKVKAFEDMKAWADQIQQPFNEATAKFKDSIKAMIDVKLTDSSDLQPDNGTGLFSRILHADSADATIDCSSQYGRHLPVALAASRVRAGCAFDYSPLLRFPCEQVGANISNPSATTNFTTKCKLPYADAERGWAHLPGTCNRTDVDFNEVQESLGLIVNDPLSKHFWTRTPTQPRGQDILSIVRGYGNSCTHLVVAAVCTCRQICSLITMFNVL